MNKRIENIQPHYTNKRFKHAQLVWGSEDAPAWDYSDRIRDWFGYEETRSAWKQSVEENEPFSPNQLQRYLQIVYSDDNLELIGVMAGYNWSTGYPYQVFGYKRSEEK